MVALTSSRDTVEKLDGKIRNVPVLAAARIYAGAMVQITAAGFAAPATATAANVTIGRAEKTVDNSLGANGALSIDVRRGIFRFANSAAADLIAATEIGKTVFVVDDQTVAKTNNGGARPAAGICYDVDAQGVWVEFN